MGCREAILSAFTLCRKFEENDFMKTAFVRLLILLIVFCLAFGLVTLWLKWKDDRGLPGFLRSQQNEMIETGKGLFRPEDYTCLLYTSPSPRDRG